MSRQANIADFLKSLERWVALQKVVLDNFKSVSDKVKDSDRLEIIIHTRIAFNHMIKTLKAFDDWLQDPFITSNIPRDELMKIWDRTLSLLEALLKMDIEHTSFVKESIEKAAREGKLNPVVAQLKDLALSAREERRPSGLSI